MVSHSFFKNLSLENFRSLRFRKCLVCEKRFSTFFNYFLSHRNIVEGSLVLIKFWFTKVFLKAKGVLHFSREILSHKTDKRKLRTGDPLMC